VAVERKFIDDSIVRYLVSSFLEKKLSRVGFSGVTIQRTPMVTRITVEVANPGRLIGKKGRSIRRLTEVISSRFNVSDPQIVVIPVEKFELEPRLMAKTIARRIEAGKPIRPIVHITLKKIMESGALGAEIRVRGVFTKGRRSKSIRAAAGYLPKAGEVTRLLKTADVTAVPKQGAINVRVTIAPPGVSFPDKEIKKIELSKTIKYA